MWPLRIFWPQLVNSADPYDTEAGNKPMMEANNTAALIERAVRLNGELVLNTPSPSPAAPRPSPTELILAEIRGEAKPPRQLSRQSERGLELKHPRQRTRRG